MINELTKIAQKFEHGATIKIDGDKKIVVVSWIARGLKPGPFVAPDGSQCRTEIFSYV